MPVSTATSTSQLVLFRVNRADHEEEEGDIAGVSIEEFE